MSTTLPVFNATPIFDDDTTPCKGCSSENTRNNCRRVVINRYDLEGAVASETDPVELLVVSDPPSMGDNMSSTYWGDKDGRKLLSLIKESGAKSFAVVPSVRCFPDGQIDHYVLDKKYRNDRRDQRPRPVDVANAAVEHCKSYVVRAVRALKPKRIVALGAQAASALDLGTNVTALRQKPWQQQRGLRTSSKNEGTIVTWDRAFARVNRWARTQLIDDLTEKLPNLTSTGFATPRGDHSTVAQITLTTVAHVEKFVDWCLNPDNPEVNRTWNPYPNAVTEDNEPDSKLRKIVFPELLEIDFETKNLHFSKDLNKILNVGFSFTSDENQAIVIPLQHPETPFSAEDLDEVFGHLKRLFQGSGGRFFGYGAHNAQFEVGIIKSFFDVWLGEDSNKPVIDSLILAYLQDENRRGVGINKPYALETLAQSYLGWTWYEETKIKGQRESLDEEPIAKVNEYVGMDAAVTSRLTNQIFDYMVEEGSLDDLLKVAAYLYGPAILYTVDMTITGQVIDDKLLFRLRSPDSSIVQRLEHIHEEFMASPKVQRAIRILQKRNDASGGIAPIFKTAAATKAKFNLSSTQHRKVLFWEVCKLKGADASVDKKFQERHKGEPLVALFTEYQQLSKLEGTYLAPIAEFIQKAGDGRVHPSFNLTNTVTGRLSANDPNTQNQPRGDTRDKKHIKCLFTVPPGMVMVQLDFSQAEVRWLGIMSGDENLARRYARAQELEEALRKDPTNKELQRAVKIEGDLHMSTAIDMYGLDPASVLDPETGQQTKDAKLKRQAAKGVCFGLIYGKGAKSLAQDLGISEEEAEAAVEKWMAQFPQAAAWLENVDQTIGKTCVSRSPFGRWRRLPEAASSDVSVANRARRQARNTPIQAAASDFCIFAACELRKALRKHSDPRLREMTKLINTVHDSLAAEVPSDADVVMEYMRIAHSIFTNTNLIKKRFGVVATVPLQVDFDIGLNWGNVQGVNLDMDDVRDAIYDAEVLRAQPTGTLLSDLKGKGLLAAETRR